MSSILGRFGALLCACLAAGVLPPAVGAAPPIVRLPASRAPAPGFAPRPFFTSVPVTGSIVVGTTVNVPDGGSVLVGGDSFYAEGRNEFGPPVLGKVPYAGRAFRNVGYGRTVRSRSVTVGVRVIDLAEEEERQTGVRSR
jgi:Flp pilus assembly secretin CpaC